MIGTAGYVNFSDNLLRNTNYHKNLVSSLQDLTSEAYEKVHVGEYAAMSGGADERTPMLKTVAGYDFVISAVGKITNAAKLKKTLAGFGYHFSTDTDTEIMLYTYIHYGTECAEKLKGSFSLAVWDDMRQRLFLCRDKVGSKSVFYTVFDGTLIFSSNLNSLLRFPGIKPELTKEGLCDILAYFPTKGDGNGIFGNFRELKKSHYLVFSRSGITVKKYGDFKPKEHTENIFDTTEHLKELAQKSLCDERVFWGNECSYNVSRKIFGDNLEFIRNKKTLGKEKLTNTIKDFLDFCAMPTMKFNEIELAEAIKENNLLGKSIMFGTGLDEFFSYAYRKNSTDILNTNTFPWIKDLKKRIYILKDEVAKTLDLEEYSQNCLKEELLNAPILFSDTEQEKQDKCNLYLALNCLASSRSTSLAQIAEFNNSEALFPFYNDEFSEYFANVPINMKREILGDFRTKKTQNTNMSVNCEIALKEVFSEVLSDSGSPIFAFCDKKRLTEISGNNELMFFVIQLNFWFLKYNVNLI